MPKSEIRRSLLSGERVIVAPNRGERPYQPEACPFCPPSPEIDGSLEAQVIPNRYPALTLDNPECYGSSEILVESRVHAEDTMVSNEQGMLSALEVAHRRMAELQKLRGIEYVHFFRNRPRAGGSLSHPHSQIYALPFVPEMVAREARGFSNSCVLCRPDLEPSADARLVYRKAGVSAYVPYAPRCAYHVQIYASHTPWTWTLTRQELTGIIHAARLVILALDSMFGETGYALCEHNRPKRAREYHCHFEILPAFRSQRQVRFSTGLERTSGVVQLDLSVEQMAASLKRAIDSLEG